MEKYIVRFYFHICDLLSARHYRHSHSFHILSQEVEGRTDGQTCYLVLILLWASPVIIVALAGGFIIFSLLFGRRK